LGWKSARRGNQRPPRLRSYTLWAKMLSMLRPRTWVLASLKELRAALRVASSVLQPPVKSRI
jgi:hypothetical protein